MALNEVGQSSVNARYDIVAGACFVLRKQPGGWIPWAIIKHRDGHSERPAFNIRVGLKSGFRLPFVSHASAEVRTPKSLSAAPSRISMPLS